MAKLQEVSVQENLHSLTKIARILVIVLIFELAGCAAGSCISYGHSCWGAHGKRNSGSNNLDDAFSQSETLNDVNDQNLFKPSYKDRKIIFRLLNGQKKLPLERYMKYLDNQDIKEISQKSRYDTSPEESENVNHLLRMLMKEI